jgi:hypothetical protein
VTTKEKIQRMLERLPEDAPYDRVVYHIEVMQLLEARLAELAKGCKLIDHDNVMVIP